MEKIGANRLGNEWECHQKPDHQSMWLKNKYIHIWYDKKSSANEDIYCCEPIQTQPELEGMIDSNLFVDGDIIIDIEYGKTYVVKLKSNIIKTTLIDMGLVNSLKAK
jgi:hypothetical protein